MTNLQEILQAFSKNEKRRAGEFISGTHISEDQAQAAIAELVEGCLPEKRSDHKLSNNNFNEAIDLIRNNLIKAGVLNG